MGGRRLAELAAFLLLAAAGCTRPGSEVGPFLPGIPESTAAATVLDPEGNVVSDAIVELDGLTTFTDPRGRFRFDKNPGLNGGIVKIDARRTTTRVVPAGIFDRLTVRIPFSENPGIAERPIPIPDFKSGASAVVSVNQGTVLSGTLTDAASGAELVLDGAVATLPGAATTAELRFVSVPADSVAAPLDPGGVSRAGALYFAIAPADLLFTSSPLVRVGDAVFGIAAAIGAGKSVAPELDSLSSATGEWELSAPAAIGGGFLSSASIAGGGMFAFSVALPTSRQTIVTALFLNREFDALEKACSLARDGRGARSDSEGTIVISHVCAADANDVAIPVVLTTVPPPFAALAAFRRDTLPGKPGVGLITDFGNRPLATGPAGRVRVQPIHKGAKLLAATVGIASKDTPLCGEHALSSKSGTEFTDVPQGPVRVYGGKLISTGQTIRAEREITMPFPGATRTSNVYLSGTKLKGNKQEGVINVFSGDSQAGTAVRDSYFLVGIDPAIAQQGFAKNGILSLQPVLPGPVLTTSGKQSEVTGVGTPVDSFRSTVYDTQLSDSTYRRAPIRPNLDLSPRGFDAAALLAGLAAGLTDPAATPPANGTYSVDPRARAAATFEERIAIALGLQEGFDGLLPPTALTPTFADPRYETFTPPGTSVLALVEHDGAAFQGPITKFGLAIDLDTPFGTVTPLDVTLAAVPEVPLTATIAGTPPDPATLRTSIVLGLEDGNGVDLGDQGSFTYVPATQLLTVQVPVVPGSTPAAIASDSGMTASGGTFVRATVLLAGGAAAPVMLTAPAVLAPPIPPGATILLDPSGTGVQWTADPATTETRLAVRRTFTGPNPAGKIVSERFDWTVRLPGAPSSFVFPALPASFKNKDVAPFFESGATYELTIEARLYETYEERIAATSPDLCPASYFHARGVARTTTIFKVP